jgi:hypothetical protein
MIHFFGARDHAHVLFTMPLSLPHTPTATLGNALTYLYPAMMYSSIVKKQNRKDQNVGVFIANCSAVLGVVMGVIGT